MSTREMAYNLIDSMTEEQILDFLKLFGKQREQNNTAKVKSVRGIFAQAANPHLIPLEKTAWEQAAVENEIAFWENYKDENS